MASVVRKRRTSEKKRERENSEYRIQNPEGENHQIQGSACRARGGQEAEQEGKQIGRKERGERKGLEIPAAVCGQEAGGSGKRWVGKWANLGKGGREAGKWTG